MRSARRDTNAGRMDKVGGRILELVGKVTGKQGEGQGRPRPRRGPDAQGRAKRGRR